MRRPLARSLVTNAGRWALNPLWRTARAVPSLDLRFAETKSLADAVSGRSLVTFTRASSATVIGSTGVLETTSVDQPRFDHDPITGESLGLLVEEQRTNLLLNSGTLSTQNVTVTAVVHTLSFSGTGTVTLSGTSTAGPLVGTGIGESNRVSLTFTPTAGTLTLTVSGTVNNAQLEPGGFRTSYIPTTTAAATRSADVVSITGTNFSSWYNQSEGTIFMEFDSATWNVSNVFSKTFSFKDSSAFENDWWIGGADTDDVYRYRVRVSNSNLFGPANITRNKTMGNKTAMAIKTFDSAVCGDGGDVTTGAPASLPVVDRVFIGSAEGFTQHTNSPIRRLTYWPARLPNITLQALTR